jgi:hypothetical protein
MSFSESGGVITQTGTDTDLSGLTGVTGVTTLAYNYQTEYRLDDKTLQIDGTCTQAFTDRLIIDGPNAGGSDKMSMVVSSGGTYKFGVPLTFNDDNSVSRTVYAGGHFLFFAKPTGPSSWKNEQAGLLVESGGAFEAYGGTIRSNQAINFESGSACVMRDATWIHTSDVGFINFYLRDSTVDIIGFKYIWGEAATGAGAVAFLANYDTLIGYEPIGIAIPIGPIDSIPHGLVIIEKYAGGYKNPIDINFRNSVDDNDEYRMMEATIGNDLIVKGRGVNDSRGWATHYIRWTPTFVDASTKAALLNIQVYMIDTDSTDRLSPYSPGDQVIDLLTLADGQFSATTLDVLTGVWHNDSDITLTTYILDDRMDITGGAIGYLYEISVLILDNSMVQEDTTLVQMVADTNITQTTIATVQAYTTIDDNGELYDAAKEELFSNYVGEAVKDVTMSGIYAVPIDNLIIDPAATPAYAIHATTEVITIKTSDFTGAIQPSGANTVTQQGTGGAINFEVDGELHIADASVPWTCSKDNTDIINDDGGDNLVVNVTGGATVATSEPGTGNGQVLLINAVSLIVHVTDTSGVDIENARVYMTATETVGTITSGDVLLTGLTNSSGIIQDLAFDYEAAFAPSGLDISVKVRQSSVSPYKKTSIQTGVILSAGYSITIAMLDDE